MRICGYDILSDYDLCTSCMSSSEQRLAHDVAHPFFPIALPESLDAYDQATQRMLKTRTSAFTQSQIAIPPPLPPRPAARSAPTSARSLDVTMEAFHIGVHCDGCGQKWLTGTRHKCVDCPGQSAPARLFVCLFVFLIRVHHRYRPVHRLCLALGRPQGALLLASVLSNRGSG